MTRFLLASGIAAAIAAGFAATIPAAGAAGIEAPAAGSLEFSSQERPRPRTRVRIYREPEPPFWEYPRPGTYSWPGPNAKRDCKAWYVVENRATGPTMTPRMTCRWVPG